MNIKKLSKALRSNGIPCMYLDETHLQIQGIDLIFLSDSLVKTKKQSFRFSYMKEFLRILDNAWIVSLDEQRMKAIIKFYKNN